MEGGAEGFELRPGGAWKCLEVLRSLRDLCIVNAGCQVEGSARRVFLQCGG